MCNTDNRIKFKTTMLKSSLCGYSNTYILLSGTIKITREGDDYVARQRNKGAIFKYRASFTDCISEINNTQMTYAKIYDVAMPMHNLVEYSNDYKKNTRKFVAIK